MNSVVGHAPVPNPRGGPPGPGYAKTSDLTGPGNVFILGDEYEITISDAFFVINSDVVGFLTDLPANRHHSAAVFSFGDGHVELHQWTTAALFQLPATPPQPPVGFNFGSNQDVRWLQNHVLNKPWY